MRRVMIVVLMIAVMTGSLMVATTGQAGEAPALKTQKDKASYGVGVDIGNSVKRLGTDLNVDLVVKGLRDALAGQKLLLSDEEIRVALTTLQAELKQKQQGAQQAAGEQNKKAGDAFLAENKKKPGVVTLPDGLQYKILKAGTGKKPAPTDTVEVHYRGTLITGAEFDSSYKRGQPATFPANGVIKGWQEALQIMPVGSKWEIYIPAELAYGQTGAGAQIGPNATLIFEVELLSIKEAPAKP